eukprot:353234-Chlamydomonas_euryale.AAC.2
MHVCNDCVQVAWLHGGRMAAWGRRTSARKRTGTHSSLDIARTWSARRSLAGPSCACVAHGFRRLQTHSCTVVLECLWGAADPHHQPCTGDAPAAAAAAADDDDVAPAAEALQPPSRM